MKYRLLPVLMFFTCSFTFAQSSDLSQLPEDPLRGHLVFESKGCSKCHQIQGTGQSMGPDLGRSLVIGSFLDFAATMWNHSPRMSSFMRRNYIQRPEFNADEVRDLATFLYYLRFLGEPGDLKHGKELLVEKGCLKCHTITEDGRNRAPNLAKLSTYASPLFLAQAMWNHGPAMEEEMRAMGLPRPQFKSNEIVDLGAYIRSLSKEADKAPIYLSPGNPRQGEKILHTKGCIECHSIYGEGGLSAPDLGESFKDCSVTEFAGIMWNHGSEMWERMSQMGKTAPIFTGREMADLMAYIYYLKFAGEPGTPERGQTVFQDKHCSDCHIQNGKGAGPDLSLSQAFETPFSLAAVLWNHAPQMEKTLSERNLLWPQFEEGQLADLYAYLNFITR